jgi:hypothetical protein
MNENCSVCGLGARATLEAQLLAGTSIRSLARQYHLGRDTIAHHKASHMTLASKVALAPPAVVVSPAATPEPTLVRTVPNATDVCIHCFRNTPWYINYRGQWEHSCGHEWKP